MRPRLAICGHAAGDHDVAASLAAEGPCTALEMTVDPEAIEASVLLASRLALRSTVPLQVRYHFPLCRLELSGPSREVADEALAAMKATVSAVAGVGGAYLTVHAALPSDSISNARFSDTAHRLTALVDAGRACEVTVALENLRWGATAKPDAFLELASSSGAAVTIDVGHAVSSEPAAQGYSAERFIADCGELVQSAHVYDRETDRHHPPSDLERIGNALDALCDLACPWWTIELIDPAEIRMTRDLLDAYLGRRFPSAVCA